MATPIGQLVVEFFANTARFYNDLDKARDKVKKTTSDISLSFSKIAEITLGVSFAKGLEGLAVSARDAVTQMAKLGLEAKVQEDAFSRLAESVGASGDALAEALTRASGDIINTSDVMLAAARGLREGFAPEQLVKLMEVARQQSKLMGVDVVTAFNAITEAIANQQTRALKNMGVVIDVDQVMSQYAATLGKSADELNNVGRSQAIYNEVIARTAGATKALTTAQLTQSEVLQRLAAQWKQLQEDLGKILVDKGLAVLDYMQTLGREIGTNLPQQLAALGEIWAATWKAATIALTPVAGILQNTLIPALKGGAVVATAFGVGLSSAFTVIAGPLAYLGSILDDLSKNKWPDHKRATLEANAAVADARVPLAEAVKALEDLQRVQPGVAKGAEQVNKSLGDLGKNTLGNVLTQTKILTTELDGLNKAIRQLAERAASGVMGELDAEIESIANGVIEAARATKGMTPDVLKGLEEWARGLARIIALNKEAQAAAKEVAEVVAASIDQGHSQDLRDDAALWNKLGIAMHDVSVIADVTGDKTGGVADKIKAIEGVLAQAITRFGSGSAQVEKFRERLQELKNTDDEFETLKSLDFEAPTGVTRDLLDEAKIWTDLRDRIRGAQREYLAVGDAVGVASAAMNQMAASIADALDRFGEGSEQVAKLRDRFRELRDDFHAAEFTESLRVVDNQARALGLSFDSLGAAIQAYRSTLARMAADPDPNWAAIDAIRARMEALEDLKVATDLVTMAASRASDEFVEWAATGKANFAEMATAIAKDISKIILRLLILRAVELATRSFGGFGGGGAEQLSGPGVTVPAGAMGGVVKHRRGGQLIIAGEKDDEAIIPLDKMGAVGGGGGDIQINIINNTPDEVSHKSEQAPDGRRIETFIISTVNRGLADGSFDKAMGIFGNKRQPVAR